MSKESLAKRSNPLQKISYQVLSTILQTRAGLASALGQTFGGARDLYNLFGYKKSISFQEYKDKYDRQDVAGRIVDLPAQATWRNNPIVTDDVNAERETEFQGAWQDLVRRRHVWHYLERVDKMAGIGRFAVLLIGVKGSGDLKRPIERVSGIDDIIFLAPYSQGSVEISSLVRDTGDARFALPLTYKIDLAAGVSNSGLSVSTKKVEVHWSRVLHVAENLEENDIFGRPRLQRVFNLFDDLAKVVGGTAETFWNVANRGMHMNVDPDVELDPDDETALSDEMDEYYNGIRRFIRTRGVKVSDLGGQNVDNRGVFSTIMALIAGAAGIPQRILVGSERGEMASTQDRANWAERTKERQGTFAEPMVLRPFVDLMISIGALPEPIDGKYSVAWPDLLDVSENERSQTASRMARAVFDISKAMDSRSGAIVGPEEFRERFLGLPAIPPSSALVPEEESEEDEI